MGVLCPLVVSNLIIEVLNQMDSQFYDNLQTFQEKDPATGENRYSGNNPYMNQQSEPVAQQYP